MMAGQWMYFNPNTRRGFLGPKPPDPVNYRKVYAQENPIMDSGDILYGMFTLANGRMDNGQFIPGYGLPISSTAFESGNSIAYRMFQWARTLPVVLLLPAALLFILSWPFLVISPNVAQFLTLISVILFLLALVLTPFVFIFALFYVPISAHNKTKRAVKEIRDQLIPPQVVEGVVESHGCPFCGTNLCFDYKHYEARCPLHGHWPIAL